MLDAPQPYKPGATARFADSLALAKRFADISGTEAGTTRYPRGTTTWEASKVAAQSPVDILGELS